MLKMNNNILISLLSGLSEAELARFGEFLQSPYFNKTQYISNFYKEFKAQLFPAGNGEKTSAGRIGNNRKEIFAKLYPGKKYNDSTFRKISSNLLKFLENFLYIESASVDLLNKNKTL